MLQGKAVLVTGAATGIGRAAAVACARAGADVALFDLHDCTDVIDEVRELGRQAISVQGDVADPAAAERFVAEARDALGRVDVLVSNAGICPFHAFLDMPVDTFQRTMHVNLHGAFFMVQAAANEMVRRGQGGAIIAVSSISALVGGEYQTHYTPTKAGVHSLMQSTAIALGKHRIRCNSVLPGTILTDINREDLADPSKRERMVARIPLGRLGEPDDIAGPIVFLASDLARYVTGAALLVDGGAFVSLQ